MSRYDTDILIIGGGIAGCIAAISLASNFRVTLVDKLKTPRERIGESLAPAARRILRTLKLMVDVDHKHISRPNLGMQSYWGSEQVRIADHMANPDGYVMNLDRRAFEELLRNRAQERGVDCRWGYKYYNSEHEAGWKVNLQSVEDHTMTAISATYVIDATGRQAHFARSQGKERLTIDKLIACWVSMPNTRENTLSTIVADRHGWWYSAVIPNERRVLAYHTDADLVDKNILKGAKSLVELAKENEVIDELIDVDLSQIQFHGTVAANSSRLEQVVGHRWATIGDAATSFDPLSSQGMFNAMATAMQLRDLILKFGLKADFAETYSSQIDQIWNHYLRHRGTFYLSENRWRTSTFWSRRRELM